MKIFLLFCLVLLFYVKNTQHFDMRSILGGSASRATRNKK